MILEFTGDLDTTPNFPRPSGPPDQGNLIGWYRADGTAYSGFNDGDPMPNFFDESGQANHLTAVGGARPTFKLAIKNSRPVFRFDGIGNFMSRLGAYNGSGVTDNLSIYAAHTFRASSGFSMVVSLVDAPSVNYNELRQDGAGFSWQSVMGNGGAPANGVTSFTIGDWAVAGLDTIFSSPLVRLWVNGLAESTGGDAATNVITAAGIGARYDGTIPCQIDIGEVLIYKSIVNPVDIQGYLAPKWL